MDTLRLIHPTLEVTNSTKAEEYHYRFYSTTTPFRDGLDYAASVGITAVIQPGGSMRDEEVIKAADEHGMTMVLTGMRHFRH